MAEKTWLRKAAGARDAELAAARAAEPPFSDRDRERAQREMFPPGKTQAEYDADHEAGQRMDETDRESEAYRKASARYWAKQPPMPTEREQWDLRARTDYEGIPWAVRPLQRLYCRFKSWVARDR
jgi:hypothetical protein